jgi:hypothetical protein
VYPCLAGAKTFDARLRNVEETASTYSKLRNRLLRKHSLIKSWPHFCELILARSFAVFSKAWYMGNVPMYFTSSPIVTHYSRAKNSNSNTLLLKLKNRLSESSSTEPWYAEAQALAVKNGPLDQYKLAIEHLLAKVETENKMRKLANVLMWNFVKEEVASIWQEWNI